MSDIAYSTHWMKLSRKEHYPLYFGDHVHLQLGEFCVKAALGRSIVIVTHPTLVTYATPIKKILFDYGFRVFIHTLPEGETHKTLPTVSGLLDSLLSLKLERHDTILAFGGGIIGDVAGFAASLYMRGLNLIQVPTSLLAQVDAAIGGKTGVNHPLGKNLIGSFYHPRFVLVDPFFLKTLPKKEVLCGLAEIVKYGIIMDAPLFKYIEKNKVKIKDLSPQKNPDIWSTLIERSLKNKVRVVSKDAKESHLRKILNFGHTIGHAIENVFQYGTYSHGEAVAIGMSSAAKLAFDLQLFSHETLQRIEALLTYLGFETQLKTCSVEALIEAMSMDKKVKNGQVQFILPTKIGGFIIKPDISTAQVVPILQRQMSHDG